MNLNKLSHEEIVKIINECTRKRDKAAFQAMEIDEVKLKDLTQKIVGEATDIFFQLEEILMTTGREKFLNLSALGAMLSMIKEDYGIGEHVEEVCTPLQYTYIKLAEMLKESRESFNEEVSCPHNEECEESEEVQ